MRINKRDITNQRFGRLIAIKKVNKTGMATWECLCDCGNTKVIPKNHLMQGLVRSCGCLRSPDLRGQKFGRLTILEKTKRRDSAGEYYWKCQCDCGNITYAVSSNLKRGSVKSCGCYARERSVYIAENIFPKVKEKYKLNGVYIPHLTSKMRVSNTSGYKGVDYNKRRKQWRARICLKGKNYHLGWFKEKEEAIKARQKAEKELFQPILEEYAKQSNH
jgi:hypothetical protein